MTTPQKTIERGIVDVEEPYRPGILVSIALTGTQKTTACPNEHGGTRFESDEVDTAQLKKIIRRTTRFKIREDLAS